MIGRSAFMVIGVVAARANVSYDFSALRHYLDSTASFYGNLSMTVGDASGVLFEYSNVDMHPDVVLQLASGSKWPGVTALMGCFAANNISIDTKLSKYLDWWTTNASDSRSNVTIRQVLSMTTGMITDPGGDGVFAEIANLSVAAFEDCDLEGGNTAQCARAMYEALPSQVVPVYLPGTKFLYTTLGFQWTAAVAEVVEGRPIGDILNAYVLDKAGMSPDCSWSNQDVNPLIGAGLECSARKLDKFVHGMLVDGIVSTKTRLEMETVQLTEPSMYGSASLYWGAYCLGNWLECLNNYRLKRLMPSQCFRADRHGHPGCNGYWNFVSRTQGYYFNMLPSYTCNSTNNYCDSPLGDANCPALYGWAQTVRTAAAMYLDDIFDVY